MGGKIFTLLRNNNEWVSGKIIYILFYYLVDKNYNFTTKERVINKKMINSLLIGVIIILLEKIIKEWEKNYFTN